MNKTNLSTEEILEGDALISEFMGEKLDPSKIIDDSVKGKALWVKLIKDQMGSDVPPYHKSWDWIMPVWDKFRRLKFNEETPTKLHLNYVTRLAQDIAYGTIGEFHHNLSIAIKWYNQQKK